MVAVQVASQVGQVTASVAEMVGGWENFGMIIGGLMASRAILAVGGFVVTVGKLVTAVMALLAPAALPLLAGVIKGIGAVLVANPIGATVTAIALAAGLITANWGKIRPALQPIIDWLGGAVAWVNDNAVKPFIDLMTSGLDGIVAAWNALRDGLGYVLDWIGEKFDAIGRKIAPVINSLKWVGEQGSAAVNSVGTFFEGPQEYQEGRSGRRQRRAVGGSFLPGSVLVGEQGPELRFENRAGFIATNRQLRGMADMADRIRGAAINGVDNATRQVTQALTIAAGAIVINPAPGMDPRAIADTVLGELQRRQRGALYDGGAN